MNEQQLKLKGTHFVSSVGDAVAGAALFGTVGAAIGGRVKEKKIKANYIVITYKKDEEVSYIVLEYDNQFDIACDIVKICIEKAKNTGLFISNDTVEL